MSARFPGPGGAALLERAHRLLAGNTRSGELNGRRYVFTVPSDSAYPFQWFWDSCFHAIVWSRIDGNRAQEELRGLLAWQSPSGFIPHVVFWNRSRVSRLSWHYLESAGRLDWFLPGRVPRTSAQIQPPLIAQAVEAIVATGADGFLAEALPALERYYRFLAERRDPDRDGLISVISQFETGLDYSPAYDGPLAIDSRRPVSVFARTRRVQLLNKLLDYDLGRVFRHSRQHVEDVLVNSIYADGLQALARLAARAGADRLEEWASRQARTVVTALLERCYDERRGLFFNLAGPHERRADGVKTVISLLPLLLADLPQDIAASLVEHLADPREFWAPYPVPSVALDEPSFSTGSHINGIRLIWRGPCSMSTNWFLIRGLRRHGYAELAEELADRCRELVERGGFNEFYNPLTGAPVGVDRFGWATLAADL